MRLLVTRPTNDSPALIAQLKNEGHEIIHVPLLEIEFFKNRDINHKDLQAVLITSANSARALQLQNSLPKLTPLLAITVGPASAQAAQLAGFTNIVQAPGGDVTGLIEYVKTNLEPENGRLLYASGNKTTGDLIKHLTNAGFDIERSVLYDALPAKKLDQTTSETIKNGKLDAVLLYSPRTAKIWTSVTKGCIPVGRLTNLTYFCLSENVAKALRQGLGENCKTTISKTPHTDAMIAAIKDSPYLS